MPVLPLSFLGNGSIGVGGTGSSMDSLQGIIGSTHGMRADMRGRNRLTGGTGSRASRIIRSYLASSSMRIK